MDTFATALDSFLADLQRRKLRPNTIKSYRADLRVAAQHLVAPLATLGLEDIEAFLGSEQRAPATTARRAATLRRFFAWAVRQHLCERNPLVDREPQRASTRRLPRPIRSTSDLDAIDAAIAQAPQPYRLIFTIVRETGMRIGEVLSLQLGDVDLSPGREGLHVRESKNGSERIAFLGSAPTPRALRGLRALLKEIKGQPAHVPLFCSNRGTQVSYAAAQYQWAQLCEELGLLDDVGGRRKLRYTLHQLRHTRGSELMRDGQPMEIVQRVLGHRDIRSTQGYAELDDLQVRAALAGRQHR